MNPHPPFDAVHTPLHQGLTLIEASAGTGKTHTIGTLVLRLLLTERLKLPEILVVTFTVAATRELRDRIRTRIHEALTELRKPGIDSISSKEPVVAAFLNCHPAAEGEAALDLALRSFDEAQIFTIHGFCQRTLQQHAFESGVRFGAELSTDTKPLLREVLHDFWRHHFYGRNAALLSIWAASDKCKVSRWLPLLNGLSNHPDLVLTPASTLGSNTDGKAFENFAQGLTQSLDSLSKTWGSEGAAIRTIIAAPGLNGRQFSQKINERHFAALDSLLSLSESGPEEGVVDAIAHLSQAKLTKATNKGQALRTHPFFSACETFIESLKPLRIELDHECARFARQQLPLRKEARNTLSFDDLLSHMREGLQDGAPLAATLRAKYKAALIDEFQDTDPVQYAIFTEAFPPPCRTFFIGDPKQAIYGFRGGDIHTYLKAASSTSHQYTLDTNYRSEAPLLDALNGFFQTSNPSGAFLHPQIQYIPVNPPKPPKITELSPASPPLRFRHLFSDEPISRWDAERLCLEAVVADVIRFQQAPPSVGEKTLHTGDLAVLVQSNKEAAAVHRLFRARGIPCVLKTDESVFESPEATEFARVMAAVLEPRNTRTIKAGLATRLFGCTAVEILDAEKDQSRWQTWVDQLAAARLLWKRSGFMALFRHLSLTFHLRTRLLGCEGGERSLTNFLHLAELLHQAASERRLAPETLLDWLVAQRNSDTTAPEEHQLRLDTEGDAVVVATIHKCKGLEYRMVFCPSLWRGAWISDKGGTLFRDPAKDHHSTYELTGKDAEARSLALEEKKTENLRILYVALTRAKHRCTVYLGNFEGFADSPLAHFLGHEDPVAAMQALVAARSTLFAHSSIDPDADAALAAFKSDRAPQPILAPRAITRSELRRVTMTSYSALAGGENNPMDRDDAAPTLPPIKDPTPVPLADFPAGARPGECLHQILEKLDFQKADNLGSLLDENLAAFQIAKKEFWKPKLETALKELLETPLHPKSFRLADIAPAHRRAETEFHIHLKPGNRSDTGSRLAELFRKHASDAIPQKFPDTLENIRLQFEEGYLHGFIDLLLEHDGRFYLLDWKSNRLGSSVQDYGQQQLRASMHEHSYFLQYHLYTLAAHLHLQRRVNGYNYDNHFGGVFYLFLRGIQPQSKDSGIFFDRPPLALVEGMRQLLLP